jgi:enamine deaminase RidA (YjgF/YER057c/UK114 family)
MKPLLILSLSTGLTFAVAPPVARAAGDGVRRIRPDDASATSSAVAVGGDANLAHTDQLLPVDRQGKLVGPGRADEQSEVVLDRLEAALKGAQSGLDRLVKVDVYVARREAVAPFRAALVRRLVAGGRPAVSYVVGELPLAGAEVALDAIAVTPMATQPPRVSPRVAVLPAGPRVFVSGQAEPDTDLAQAARKTLEGLDATLKHLGLDRSRVVRLKAFLQPASGAAEVEREVAAFFGGKDVPPLSFVTWSSSPKQPIEIELVAAGRESDGAGGPTIEYLTPPALKPSPVFSRVARVNRGDLIYVSGLFGPSGASGPAQVEAIFDALGKVLTEAGSDLRHMAKATYYVSDDVTSRALNDLRPKYYDPSRPPAASKALVAGVGAEGRSITLDMIAVPAR